MVNFFSFFVSLTYIFIFPTQTLTTLDLGGSDVEGKGAKHLADALKYNTVNLFLSLSLEFLFSLFT
jgi:hypothetical protein